MAFALGIHYLTGYSVAATRPDGEPEWPPHPARVFMAMAAAHFEAPGDPLASSEAAFQRSCEQEREALQWFESLGEQPLICASDADARPALTCFVPVNDHPVGKKPGALQSVPGWRRSKQPRTFPRVRPHDDRVFFVWNCELPAEHRDALERLCAKVTRIGHSSSLVRMWLADPSEAPEPNWLPDDDRPLRSLRRMSPGFLDNLEDLFGEKDRQCHRSLTDLKERLKKEKSGVGGRGAAQRKAQLQSQIDEIEEQLRRIPPLRRPLRPTVGLWQGYGRPAEKINGQLPGTVWDSRLVILRMEPERSRFARLDLASTLQVTGRMRDAMLQRAHGLLCGCNQWEHCIPPREQARQCWQKLPEWLTGHQPEGPPSERPHLAYLPLAFLGHPHSDGHLMGLAVAMPATLERREWGVLWRITEQVCQSGLNLGRLGRWRLAFEDRELPPVALREQMWTAGERGATCWASVTPVAFDQHPKAKDRAAYEELVAAMIRGGCRRIGLPEPIQVCLTPVSAHRGAPASHDFPALMRKDGSPRRHSHAILVFDQAVRGPIAVGAGRYRGYGWFRPVRELEAP